LKTSTKTEKPNYIKVFTNVLSSTKLTAQQKLIIQYVISLQASNLTCTDSNNQLAVKFGIEVRTLQYCITQLNQYDWFISKKSSIKTKDGGYFNNKVMIVNEDLFSQWLAITDEAPLKLEATKNQPQIKPNKPAISKAIQTPAIEPKAAQKPKETSLEDDLGITIDSASTLSEIDLLVEDYQLIADHIKSIYYFGVSPKIVDDFKSKLDKGQITNRYQIDAILEEKKLGIYA